MRTKEEQKIYNKQYHKMNREYILERKRHNYRINIMREKRRIRRYYQEHKEYFKQYRQTHLKQTGEDAKKWAQNHPEQVREMKKKETNRRKRELGFIPLNEYFVGSDAHHINPNDVIYIPKKLHRSVSHCLKTGHNMQEMNVLACKWVILHCFHRGII